MKETTPKENIYSKLKLVNCLNNKMIDRLNSKYLSLGLQMKQIKVDKYGNELIGKDPKEIIGQKRDRKGFNSLNKFLFGYYGKKKFNVLHENYEKEKKSIFDFNPEDKICTRKCLSQLKDSLNKIKIDCEYMANKNSKIETDEYKEVVLKFISQFKKYITNEQYIFLYNKWKNELLKVRGTDLFNFDKINNINNWKVSILKCFKSEIVLYGICNIYDGVIKGSKFVNDNKIKLIEDSEEKEEKKIIESDDDNDSEDDNYNDSSSESELTDKTLERNIINS